jgi:hypothetical protein
MKTYIRSEEWETGDYAIRLLRSLSQKEYYNTIRNWSSLCKDLFIFPKLVIDPILFLIGKGKLSEALALWDKKAFPGKPRSLVLCFGIWLREKLSFE